MSEVSERVHRLYRSYPVSANPKDRTDSRDSLPFIPSDTEACTLSRIDLYALGSEEALHIGKRARDSNLLLFQ